MQMECEEPSLVTLLGGEDDNSLSGLSDCLIELEAANDEDRDIPFRSYLDSSTPFSLSDLEVHENQKISNDASTSTESPMLLSGNVQSGGSVELPAYPHYVHRLLNGEDVLRVLGGHCDHQPQGNYPEVQNTMSPGNHTTDRPPFLSSGRNSRTPRTLLRLQEKHRENERVRHHTLIKNMKAVCGRVPGYDEKAKETKVVMMQRVVDYICHLEQTTQSLIEELGISLDLSSTFLTTKIKKQADDEKSSKEHNSASQCGKYRRGGDPFLARYVPDLVDEPLLHEDTPLQMLKNPDDMDHRMKLRRRQKISSPTVGSSSDPVLPQTYEINGSQSSLSSNDSGKPQSSNIPYVEDMILSSSPLPWITSDSFDPFNIHSKDDFLTADENLGFGTSDDYEVSSSLSMQLHSPLNNEIETVNLSSIRNEYKDEELKPVNPDRVLQMKKEVPLSFDKLIKLIELKKATYLERHPLTSITNMTKKDTEMKPVSVRAVIPESSAPIVDKNLRSDIGKKDEEGFVSYVPYMWKFHDISMTRRQKAAAARIELQMEKENNKTQQETLEKTDPKPTKVDLRKTSWMNGFMMFSRINRRMFIDANPGVHTSHISKMMGHTWRNMPDDEQKPYKEKAKKYMQYMQKSFEPTDFSTDTAMVSTDNVEGSNISPSAGSSSDVSCILSESDSLLKEVPGGITPQVIAVPKHKQSGKSGPPDKKRPVSLLKRNKNKCSSEAEPNVSDVTKVEFKQGKDV